MPGDGKIASMVTKSNFPSMAKLKKDLDDAPRRILGRISGILPDAGKRSAQFLRSRSDRIDDGDFRRGDSGDESVHADSARVTCLRM